MTPLPAPTAFAVSLLVLVAVAGLTVGSFLNVVIHRVPLRESVASPASHCPSCRTPIRARHNVPVLSWVLLRGRCAYCSVPISVRYPLVEAGTAAVFVLITLRFGFTAQLPAYLYLAAVGVALAGIDLDVQRLPNIIVLPSYGVGAVLLAVAAGVDGTWTAALRGLVAMAALLAVFCAIAVAYPGGMGGGDIKLAGLLGLFLGWIGWGSVVVGSLAAFTLGAVVGVTLVLTRVRGRRSALPFGPFLLAGTLLALFVAAPVVSWYSDLLVSTT